MKRIVALIAPALMLSAGASAQSPFTFSGTVTGVSPSPGARPLSAAGLNMAAATKADAQNGILTTPSINIDGQVRAVFGPAAVSSPFYTSPDSFAFGGGIVGAGASITLRGQPYGCNDAGTLFSMVNTGLTIAQSPAGVAGACGGPAVVSGYGGIDTVNFFNQVGSIAPPVFVSGVTYDATHIYPATGSTFTTAQVAWINAHPGANVITNSVDPTVSAAPPSGIVNGIPAVTQYVSATVLAAPTEIVVQGWTVPGSGHAETGQVPTSAFPQTASIGASFKQFAANETMYKLPGIAGDWTNQFEKLEIDMTDEDTVDYSTSFHGETCAFTPTGITPAANGVAAHNVLPAADSYCYKMAGPLPTLLELRGIAGTYEIDADSLRLMIGASPAPGVGSQSLQQVQRMFVDSNQADLMTYAQRDVTGTGPATSSIHLALTYDPTTWGQIGGGTPMAQMVWNQQGYYGGMSLCSASGACGFNMSNAGTLYLPNGVFVTGGGFDLAGVATLRSAVTVSGPLTTNAAFVQAASYTPPSSNSPCIVGQEAWDANYEYRCVSLNTWKRQALGAF